MSGQIQAQLEIESYSLIETLNYHAEIGNIEYLIKWATPFDATSWLPQMYPDCNTNGCYFFVSILRDIKVTGRFVAEINSTRGDRLDPMASDDAFDPAYRFVSKRLQAWGEIGFRQIPQAPRVGFEDFYKTQEWQRLRYRALEYYGGRCSACGRTAKSGVGIHVDHIKPKFRFPELALNFENLQILCSDCNLGKGCDYVTSWQRGYE